MPAGGHEPRQLQGPGALADPLRPTKQEQLTYPEPTVQVRVERAEPRRNAPQPVRPPRPHVLVELLQHPTQADNPMPMHPRLPRRRHPDPLQAASATPGSLGTPRRLRIRRTAHPKQTSPPRCDPHHRTVDSPPPRACSSAGERCLHTAEATGSKPVTPTSTNRFLSPLPEPICQQIASKPLQVGTRTL